MRYLMRPLLNYTPLCLVHRMSLALDLQSETYPPTGSIAAEGVKNQLGRPKADRLAVMVREAVQNSWDASAGEGPVLFGIHCWQATGEQLEVLRNTVFRTVPPETAINAQLARESGYMLTVYDRHTVGLGGPTRADVGAEPGQRTDFVDFLRNIGQPPDHEFGGGTYGYGKAAFYTATHLRAICVHTRCSTPAGLESRFLAAGLGRQFTDREGRNGKRYTGRHWWGRLSGDGVVDPLVNREADLVAEALGLPAYPDGGRGTTILLPFPDFEEREAEEAVQSVSHALLRYFWPKMVDGLNGLGTMRFRLTLNHTDIAIPHPSEIPELKGYVAAFAPLADSKPQGIQLVDSRIASIDCRNPIKHLGKLSLVRYTPLPRPLSASAESTSESGEDPLKVASCHHIALMRTPHFVVRYLVGPAVPYAQLEYAGVFLVDRTADAPFARSEPPTHDDWVPDGLEDPRERTYVRMAFRRIGEALSAFVQPPPQAGAGHAEVPLGAFADELASLIPAERGPGAARISTGGINTGGNDRSDSGGGRTTGTVGGIRGGPNSQPHRRAARLSVVQTGRIDLLNNSPVLMVDFDIEHLRDEAVNVRASASVILEGGSIEAEAPIGSARPQVVEWIRPDGGRLVGGESITILPTQSGRWSVAVGIPDDAMVGVSVDLI